MWWGIGARRKVGAMYKVTSLVTDGHVSEGLAAFRKLPTLEQQLMKINVYGALSDCANFLSPEADYRGDDKTIDRLSELKHTHEFAQGIDVTHPVLDELVAIQGRFNQEKFMAALKALPRGEKTILVNSVIHDLNPTGIAPEKATLKI